jgi:hypothetical protein
MAINVPQVNPRLANIQAPNLPRINVGGAIESGVNLGQKLKGIREQDQLQSLVQEQGQAALGGDQDALNQIALQGPDGAELAGSLQQIVASRNEQQVGLAQRQIKKQGTFLASIVKAKPEVQRRKIFEQANKLLSEGDRERGAEFLRISQLKDELEIQGEIESGLVLSQGGDKFLQGFITQTGDRKKVINKINEETRGRIGKQLTTVKDTVSSIESNARKIKGLTKQIEKGNRGSVAQTIISMVKLGEPNSAVLVAEMEAALNNPALMAGALKAIEDQATTPALKALATRIDPLNPENIDINDILSTSNAIVQGQSQSILDNFNDARSQSIDLTEEGSRALFAGNISDRISNLDGIFQLEETPALELVTAEEQARLTPEKAARLNELRKARQ